MKTLFIALLMFMAVAAQVRDKHTVTVAEDDSTTRVIDLGNYQVAAVRVPSDWTTANLYVMASDSVKGTYSFVQDEAGDLFYIVATAGRWTKINPTKLMQFRYIKFVSMLTGSYVVQTSADKIIQFLTVKIL